MPRPSPNNTPDPRPTSRGLLIGLVGEIGHGKSSVAKTLEHGCAHVVLTGSARCSFKRMSFATPLKEACASVCSELGVPATAFFGTQDEKAAPQPALGGASGRTLLQRVGTDGFRAAYPRFWVDIAIRRAGTLTTSGQHGVFEDVRFADEAAAIRAAGGVIWRVVKTDTRPAWRRALARLAGLFRREHASETEARRIVADATITAAPGEMQELERSTHAELRALLTHHQENR